MIIRHFNIRTPNTPPPERIGWQPTWHGYWEMAKCETPERKKGYLIDDKYTHDAGMLTEWEFERDCLLSILTEIKNPQVNMFEIGAGWGRMSLALAGIIDHKLVPFIPSWYRCLAVEAEPTHYEWIKEHFKVNKINGTAVHGAVSNRIGTALFDVNDSPDAQYGQAMVSSWNVRHILSKNTATVRAYTVDKLMQIYGFTRVDILDIDVQGAEVKVIQGAMESIKSGLINYILIGTHGKKYNEQIRNMLPDFKLVIDAYPNGVTKMLGFPPVKLHDGVQLYKRKVSN